LARRRVGPALLDAPAFDASADFYLIPKDAFVGDHMPNQAHMAYPQGQRSSLRRV